MQAAREELLCSMRQIIDNNKLYRESVGKHTAKRSVDDFKFLRYSLQWYVSQLIRVLKILSLGISTYYYITLIY